MKNTLYNIASSKQFFLLQLFFSQIIKAKNINQKYDKGHIQKQRMLLEGILKRSVSFLLLVDVILAISPVA